MQKYRRIAGLLIIVIALGYTYYQQNYSRERVYFADEAAYVLLNKDEKVVEIDEFIRKRYALCCLIEGAEPEIVAAIGGKHRRSFIARINGYQPTEDGLYDLVDAIRADSTYTQTYGISKTLEGGQILKRYHLLLKRNKDIVYRTLLTANGSVYIYDLVARGDLATFKSFMTQGNSYVNDRLIVK